nr:MAG: chromosome segregation ATPase [Podoviridae sp. ctka020]
MLFKNRQESGVHNPPLSAVKEKLRQLYEDVEIKEKRLAELEGKITERENLTEEVAKLEEKRSSLQHDIDDLELAKKKQQEVIHEKETELTSIVLQKTRQKEALDFEITQKRNELQNIEDGHKKRVEDLLFQIRTLENEVEKNIEKTRKSDDDAFSAKERLAALHGEYAEVMSAKTLLEGDIAALEKKKGDTQNDFEKTVEQNRKVLDRHYELLQGIKVAEAKLQELGKKMADFQKEMDVKLGEVSLRESLVKEKTDQLIRAKKQLEEYFNKPLTKIII